MSPGVEVLSGLGHVDPGLWEPPGDGFQAKKGRRQVEMEPTEARREQDTVAKRMARARRTVELDAMPSPPSSSGSPTAAQAAFRGSHADRRGSAWK